MPAGLNRPPREILLYLFSIFAIILNYFIYKNIIFLLAPMIWSLFFS